MADSNRRNRTIFIVLILLLIVIALILFRCSCQLTPAPVPQPAPATSATTPDAAPAPPPAPAAVEPDEVLTPATLTAPTSIPAGAPISVAWTGPDNKGDYITIVRPDSADTAFTHYKETKDGTPIELTSPIEPGAYEIRYVTARSHTVLGRAPIEVVAAGATINAAAEVTLGAPFPVSWTGPNNKGDYITIVAKGAPDASYTSYVDADKAPPQNLTAPTTAGDAELRYVTGQGKKVLVRRDIKVVMPAVSLGAPAEAVAGSTIQVTWTGPNNAGDYVTVVAAQTPDGQYANYTLTSTGSPLSLPMPIMDGAAELRYMTGQGNKVLARTAIRIVAAQVTLAGPQQGAPGEAVSITWTGPNNAGDYITIVAKGTPDGQYGHYTMTTDGSPLSVNLPATPGDAEVRYMSGQGDRVLARVPIKVVP